MSLEKARSLGSAEIFINLRSDLTDPIVKSGQKGTGQKQTGISSVWPHYLPHHSVNSQSVRAFLIQGEVQALTGILVL